jgi:hypothetical protein
MASQVASAPGRTAGVAAQAHNAVALGDGRVRLVWVDADTTAPGAATGGPGAAQHLRPEAAGFGDATFARLLRLILSDAVSEAAAVQSQASGQSAAISEVAEREAAEISRQASAQIAAIREAAEREAAELRAAVLEAPGGLAGVVCVPEDLISPVRPATRPRTRPGTGSKGRQVRAMRKVVIAFAALSLVGVGSGAAEITLHGLGFFMFRNAGAGAGNSRDLNENQGPGQPDAPVGHHDPRHHAAAAPATTPPAPAPSFTHRDHPPRDEKA